MRRIASLVTALALLGAACGSSQSQPAEPEPAPAEDTEPAHAETAEPAPQPYPPEVRESFMTECLVSGDEEACSCVLAKLEANISIEDLSAGNFERETIEAWTMECLESLGRELPPASDAPPPDSPDDDNE